MGSHFLFMKIPLLQLEQSILPEISHSLVKKNLFSNSFFTFTISFFIFNILLIYSHALVHKHKYISPPECSCRHLPATDWFEYWGVCHTIPYNTIYG